MQNVFSVAWKCCVVSIVLVFVSFHSFVHASTINVGTYPCPPFVIGSTDTELKGLSIELWQSIAQEIEVDFTFKIYSLNDLLQAIEEKQVDIGASCISITPDRELFADFSHSFYETHLAIAVKNQGYLEVFRTIFLNPDLWLAIFGVLTIASLVGAFFFFLEKDGNEKLYSMNSRIGRWIEAFILGLLFITRGPFNYFEFKTLTARIVTVLIALFSTLFIASITAILASKLTLSQNHLQIQSVSDLAGVKVGAKEATTSSLLLTNFGIKYRAYQDTPALLDALDNGELDAIVADDVVLKYMIGHAQTTTGQYSNLRVLPYQLEKQNYGFIMPENTPYEEEINRALLNIRESNEWRKTLSDYFAEK